MEQLGPNVSPQDMLQQVKTSLNAILIMAATFLVDCCVCQQSLARHYLLITIDTMECVIYKLLIGCNCLLYFTC